MSIIENLAVANISLGEDISRSGDLHFLTPNTIYQENSILSLKDLNRLGLISTQSNTIKSILPDIGKYISLLQSQSNIIQSPINLIAEKEVANLYETTIPKDTILPLSFLTRSDVKLESFVDNVLNRLSPQSNSAKSTNSEPQYFSSLVVPINTNNGTEKTVMTREAVELKSDNQVYEDWESFADSELPNRSNKQSRSKSLLLKLYQMLKQYLSK